VEEILRRAAPLAAGHAPFPLATAPLGGFPSLGRARVAWLGFQPQPALEALALDLRKALQEGGVTFDPKPFRPHLTLARLKAPARLDPQALDPPPSLSFQVERVLLYRSHLSQQGSRFEALGGVELQGLPGGSGRPVLQ
jgi:2'-5' RNA ligase